MNSQCFKIGLKITVLLFFCFTLSGCVIIYNPATRRNELILINTPREVGIGRNLDREISRKFKILKDPAINARLGKVGQRVAAASDRKDLLYHFRVVDSKELNAFCLPGGFIYIHSRLMDIATDDELACVIAHEVGHIAARHAIKKLQAALGYRLVISLALRNVSSIILKDALNIMYNLITLGYSRHDEREADRLAVKYAHRSGYNPEAMISFFRKLLKEKKVSRHLIFLRSHPPVEERIRDVKEEIKRIEGSLE